MRKSTIMQALLDAFEQSQAEPYQATCGCGAQVKSVDKDLVDSFVFWHIRSCKSRPSDSKPS